MEEPTEEVVNLSGMASLMKADFYSTTVAHDPVPEKYTPVVTISRSYGTDGTEVGLRLAELLRSRFYDRELLNEVCQQLHADKFIMEKIYEKPVSKVDDAIYSMLGMGGNAELMRILPVIIAKIQRTGGVILGRGAHLFSDTERMFRVRLEGSLPVCARRIMQRLNVAEPVARDLIRVKNAESEAFTRAIYKKKHGKRQFYDLVINTDLFTTEQMVEMILCAMQMKGFAIPAAVEEALPRLPDSTDWLPALGAIHSRASGFRMKSVTYPAGEVIFREGEVADCMYVIKSGAVEVAMRLGDSMHAIAVLETGEVVGELALFTTNKLHMYAAKAREETTLTPIDERQLLEYLQSAPQLALRLLHHSANRIAELGVKMQGLVQLTTDDSRLTLHQEQPRRARWSEESASRLRLLVVEDDPDYFELLRTWLERSQGENTMLMGQPQLQIVHSTTLAGAVEQLRHARHAVVLLDLNLPDSKGLTTFERLQGNFPDQPYVVLSGIDNEPLAIKAVRKGAQDYLVKTEVNRRQLTLALRYAMERHLRQGGQLKEPVVAA